MAAVIDRTGSGPLFGVEPWAGRNKVYIMRNVIDLSGAATAADLTVYQCLAIPKDTLVMQVRIEILTPATGANVTFDVGDGTNVSGWIAGVNMRAAAGTFASSAVGTNAFAVAATMGKFYEVADSIDTLINIATTQDGVGPRFAISALCVDFNA